MGVGSGSLLTLSTSEKSHEYPNPKARPTLLSVEAVSSLCLGCHNKTPQIDVDKLIEIYFLTFLEVRGQELVSGKNALSWLLNSHFLCSDYMMGRERERKLSYKDT